VQNIGIREIAEKAEVSIGTVDRVIHNRGGVSKSTKEKIQEIIRKYHYEPNMIARTLASRKRYLLATLIPFYTRNNTYWSGPLEGIKKAASEIADFSVSLSYYFFDQHHADTFYEATKKLLNSTPDAVLLAPVFYHESLAFLKACEERGIPYVFIDSNIRGLKNISYFGQDSFQSGYLAARLISIGCTSKSRFLVIHVAKEEENINHLKQRENGFRAWFGDHEHLGKAVIETLYISGSEKSAVKRLLPSIHNHKTKGIFITCNAHIIARSIKQMKTDHLRLIGYDMTKDNLKFLKSGTIDFLICQKPREQGYHGVYSLFNYLVHKKPVKALHLMPIDIITRENYRYYLEFE